MVDSYLLRQEADGLRKKLARLRSRIVREGKQLTEEEVEFVENALTRLKQMRDQLDLIGFEDVDGRIPLERFSGGSGGGDIMKAIKPGSEGASKRTYRGYELRGPHDDKSFRSLFGQDGPGGEWRDKHVNFYQVVFSGRLHPELQQRASVTETVPSSGGFLIPTQYAEKIHSASLEKEIVQPRAHVQPMRSSEIKLPAMAIGDHSSNLYGGFTAGYTAETGTISVANPTTRQLTLKAKKLTGLLRMSNELAADAPGGPDEITRICGQGLAWYRDKSFLKGSGAGEPQGILNAPCLVVQNKESGQTASNIVYENLTKMLSRLWPGSFDNAVWVAHITTIPQLLGLMIEGSVGGSHYPVLSESNGTWRMLTRPVIFTEKTEPLGSQGDLCLCDFSQYVIGLRGDMRLDYSAHVHFTTDELSARLIERHDGAPLWSEALTLLDGSTTVSRFVTLQVRS